MVLDVLAATSQRRDAKLDHIQQAAPPAHATTSKWHSCACVLGCFI
jgi:hypothetical protein